MKLKEAEVCVKNKTWCVESGLAHPYQIKRITKKHFALMFLHDGVKIHISKLVKCENSKEWLELIKQRNFRLKRLQN